MPYCQPRSSHPQRKKPPTFQAPGTFLSFIVCDADTSPLQGRVDYTPPADGNVRIIDPTRSTEIAVFTNTPYVVDCVLSIASPEHFWPRLRFSALRLKTAAVFGSIDCSFRLHSASSTPPSLCFGGMALHSVCTRKLSLATTFRLSPTPLLCRGVGPPPFHRQPETSACYSGPSMPCRRSPSSGRREPTLSALLPPREEDVIAIQSVGYLLYIVCDAGPNPRPRCAVRRCTDSTPAVGQPLHSLRVCLRLRARAGRLTVCGASSSTESLSLRTSATPAVCANPM